MINQAKTPGIINNQIKAVFELITNPIHEISYARSGYVSAARVSGEVRHEISCTRRG